MELDFRLDYLSDFVNLVFILSGMDETPQPWDLDFTVDRHTEEKLEKLNEKGKTRFKEQAKKRELGDSFNQWKERCEGAWYWSFLEELNEGYRKHWDSKSEDLEVEKERKEKIWKKNFDNFFERAEKKAGLSWSREGYVAVISDSLYMGGYWDPFDRNVVYIGAYSNKEVYKYVISHELLHLLTEQENISDDYFQREDYPELITHDIIELVIPLIQSEVVDLTLEESIQYITHSPTRRWILLKQVYKAYSTEKRFKEIIKDIKNALSQKDIEEYKLLYDYEEPNSILLDY